MIPPKFLHFLEAAKFANLHALSNEVPNEIANVNAPCHTSPAASVSIALSGVTQIWLRQYSCFPSA